MDTENTITVGQRPLLSVVMPVYNGEKYLVEAIESVLAQSYPNFEFIVINDGSKDNTGTIVRSYQGKDSRIHYIELRRNAGISNALNMGIRASKGEYIVRMDCDDMIHPDRLLRQLRYFQDNAGEFDVLGSYFCVFYDESTSECETVPAHIDDIHNGKPPVHHPTCMIRRNIFFDYGWYDSAYDNAEDYDLWVRLFSQGVRFENMTDVLYRKRIHRGSVSISRIKHQIYIMLRIDFKAIFKYHIRFTARGYAHILEQFLYLVYLSLGLNRIYARGKTVK